MQFTLQTEKEERGKLTRTYTNQSGTEIKTHLIYTDPKTEKRYWGFIDLYKIPVIRIVMSKHIADLFSIGLTFKDIQNWCKKEKELLRGSDPEKYEKLYALVLEKESLAEMTANPIKQHLALTTVYVLDDEERIDYFTEAMAEEKMKVWNTSPDMVAFFLSWHTEHIRSYTKTLNNLSKTVLTIQKVEDQRREQLNK